MPEIAVIVNLAASKLILIVMQLEANNNSILVYPNVTLKSVIIKMANAEPNIAQILAVMNNISQMNVHEVAIAKIVTFRNINAKLMKHVMVLINV